MSSGVSSDKVDLLLRSSNTLISSMGGLKNSLEIPEITIQIKICVDNVQFSWEKVHSFYQIFIRDYDSYKTDIYESQEAKSFALSWNITALDQFAFNIKLDEP